MKLPLHLALLFPMTICCIASRPNAENIGDLTEKKPQQGNQKKIKRAADDSRALVDKYDEDGIYWRFPNVSPELSDATKELTLVEKMSPLDHHCAELALRITWLFWWNLNETATKKEHDHWKQELLKQDGLLDKIQPKNVQNFNACMNGVQMFVEWQLEQIGKGKLTMDEESEQFLRQIHQELTILMEKGQLPSKIKKPFEEIEKSHELFRDLKQQFHEKFQFYIEMMEKIVLSISKKKQLKEQIVKKLVENMEKLEDKRIRVDILFDAKRIWEKARELEKIFELEHRQMEVHNGKVPEITATEEKSSSLVENLCEVLLGNFAAKLADKKLTIKLANAQKYYAQHFASHLREWCQKMQNYKAQTTSVWKPNFQTRKMMIMLEHMWQDFKEETFKTMESLPELALLFHLETVEWELPEMAVKFHRNAVRALVKWKAGTTQQSLSSASKTTMFTMNKAKEVENEWKMARQLFKGILAKMAELGLNFQMNMDGRISRHQVESWIKKKPKNPRNFYLDEVLAFSCLVINSYNEMKLYRKAELRIRAYTRNEEEISTHFTILVGDIEYDYGEMGLQRRRLKNPMDENVITDENKIVKVTSSEPLTAGGMVMVDVKEADKVYYELLDSGYWPKEGLYTGLRNCRTFTYFFVCRLFSDKCPKREQWPLWFVNHTLGKGGFDNYRKKFAKMIPDTSKHVQKECETFEEYSEQLNVFRTHFYQDLLDASKQAQKEHNCQLRDVEFKFKVYGAGKNATVNELAINSLLPLLVSYTGGIMWNKEKQYFDERYGGTFNGQSEAECVDDNAYQSGSSAGSMLPGMDIHTCSTMMKVFVCTEKEGNDTAAVGNQQQQQPILLEDVIFYNRLTTEYQIEKICTIDMFDLSFHAEKNKNIAAYNAMPIVNLNKYSCGGAGTDMKSPIEETERDEKTGLNQLVN